jgi:hypothetical protein
MTISEFGKVNQLKSPLLKSVFGLTSDDDFSKKLEGLSLNQKKVLNQVNNELSVQAKSENILVTWFNEINRKLLHNFGLVTKRYPTFWSALSCCSGSTTNCFHLNP